MKQGTDQAHSLSSLFMLYNLCLAPLKVIPSCPYGECQAPLPPAHKDGMLNLLCLRTFALCFSEPQHSPAYFKGRSEPSLYLEADCLVCSQAVCFTALLHVRECKVQCVLVGLKVLYMCIDAEEASCPLCNRAPATRLAMSDLKMMQ